MSFEGENKGERGEGRKTEFKLHCQVYLTVLKLNFLKYLELPLDFFYWEAIDIPELVIW